jgi:hypothetical protein
LRGGRRGGNRPRKGERHRPVHLSPFLPGPAFSRPAITRSSDAVAFLRAVFCQAAHVLSGGSSEETASSQRSGSRATRRPVAL